LLHMLSKLFRPRLTRTLCAQVKSTPIIFNNAFRFASSSADGVDRDVTTPQPSTERPIVRLYDVNPNPTIRSWAETMQPSRPGDKHFLDDLWLSASQQWEVAVGSERAELIDPNMWNDLLPEVIDIENGDGSTPENAIVISSQYESERVVGCFGYCYDGDLQDFDEATPQYWVMKTNTYSMCEECGLFFFLAHPLQLEKMQLEQYIQKEFGQENDTIKLLSEDEIVKRIAKLKEDNTDLEANDEYLRQVVLEANELEENERIENDKQYRFGRSVIANIGRHLQEEDIEYLTKISPPEIQRLLSLSTEDFVKELSAEDAKSFKEAHDKLASNELTTDEAFDLLKDIRIRRQTSRQLEAEASAKRLSA